MKIQELAIVFILVIFPISLVLSEYTQFQIKTLNTQTEYDAKLTAATYDAIKAFQLNAKNETYSDVATVRMENIEASVNAFRNSITSSFKLNGYSEEDLNNYIPALVYTLYDGFYIYSPFINNTYQSVTDPATGDITGYDYTTVTTDMSYGLKSYITYSCRYVKGTIDVVITYALDNYIKVEGYIDSSTYVNRSGYLIDPNNIDIVGDTVKYDAGGMEITIVEEKLKEYLPVPNYYGYIPDAYSYAKIDGVKYYLIEDYYKDSYYDTNLGVTVETIKDCIVYISNGIPTIQAKEGNSDFEVYKNWINGNKSAKEYYKQAYEFSNWFYNETSLATLRYCDAKDQIIGDDGYVKVDNIWESTNTELIFKDTAHDVENELSNFNQHRLKIIRHKIEVNLAIAIANYNEYSGVSNVFQMPLIKDDEWDCIINNISLISFLQGLNIGGKIYNGYSIVTNSESEEVVLEENIYILTTNILDGEGTYRKIGDKEINDGTLAGEGWINATEYAGDTVDYNGYIRSSGRLNLDFERTQVTVNGEVIYYYPLKNYNASYDSIVMQDNVESYDDIYEYINGSGDDQLALAFYTALGRERASKNLTIDNVKTILGL